MRNYIICFSSLCILLTGAIVTAEENMNSANNNKTLLGYNEYLAKISESLPEIKTNGINLLLQENAVKSAKSLGDISLKAGGTYSSSNQLSGTDKGVVKINEYYAGLNKRIVPTGTDIDAGFDYTGTGYSDFSTFNEYNTYVPSVYFKIKQPLLYNFLGKVDKFSEKDALMKTEIEKVRLLENNKSVLNNYKKLFFQYILYTDIIHNIETSVKNSRNLREQVGRNKKAGIAEEDDYQRTVASVLQYEQQLESYKTSLKTIDSQIGIYVDTVSISPDHNEFTKYSGISLNNNYDYVDFEKTSSARILDLSLKELIYSKDVQENKLLPEFYATAGITKKNLATGSSDAASGLPYNDYSVGFEFSYKFGNNTAEAELETVKLQMRQLGYEYESTSNSYKKTLLLIKESAAGTITLLKKKDEYLESLVRRLAAEKEKYKRGRIALSYLIETENLIAATTTDIAGLKYELIANYIDYQDLVQ